MNHTGIKKLINETRKKLENYEIPEEKIEEYLKEFLVNFIQHIIENDTEYYNSLDISVVETEILNDYLSLLKKKP